jgi:hypothetical protein
MKELKKILLFIFCFSASLIIADRIIGFVLHKIFEKTYTGQSGGKINYYLQKINCEILILGDSRAMNQIIPDSFSIPTFNLAHAGMDDVFQEALLDLVLAKHKKPKVILLHIDPMNFTAQDDILVKSQYLKQFYGESPLLTSYIDSSGKYEKLKYFFSSYKYNNALFSLLNNRIRDAEKSNSGYEPIPPTPQDIERTKITSRGDTLDYIAAANQKKIDRLDRMIKRCRNLNIRVICFTAPVWRETNELKIQRVYDDINACCKQNQTHFFDYSHSESKTNILMKEGYWYDSKHLNERGAKYFSAIIARDVVPIIFSPTSTHFP